MDLSLKVFSIFVVLTMFIFVQGNIYIRQNTKEEIFNNSRQANLDSANATLDKIDNFAIISQHELLEEWLTTFIENNDLSMNEVVLKFGVVNTDPQVIVVKVEGYDEYIYLDGENDAIVSYVNSIMNEQVE